MGENEAQWGIYKSIQTSHVDDELLDFNFWF
jgi:hypothetical protein